MPLLALVPARQSSRCGSRLGQAVHERHSRSLSGANAGDWSGTHYVSEVKVVKNRHPLALDAEREWEEEQEALGNVDRSRYVYKFRSFDSKGYTLDALAASHLWCSHFQSFNDIFEFRFDYDRHPAKTDEMFKLWRREFPQYADMSRKMVPIYGIEIVKSLLDDIGVCCFAKDPLNPLMWAYYAELSYRHVPCF